MPPNPHLPTKTCEHCRRPFAWRKKWERDWDQVRYCSKACTAAARKNRRDQSSNDNIR
ncbi:MAG: DUF2256 domain-containing protein [Phycisphaeraceae bacterium]